MESQYVTRTVTWTSNGTEQTMDMVEAQFTSRGPYSWKKWYNCHICGHSYPEDQVILKGGVAYCVPLECYYEMDD